MRTVLIDNYDSFSRNLYHQIFRATGFEPEVRTNDQLDLDDLRRMAPDAVVISPGPGHPGVARDFGICAQVIRDGSWPILGICLGFQGLLSAQGLKITRGPEPVHGHASEVFHTGTSLFRGLPQPFQAVRYHSLTVVGELPPSLERLAWTKDGLLMAIRDRSKPHWGLQFHPESIGSEYGDELVAAFFSEVSPQPRRRKTRTVVEPLEQAARPESEASAGPTRRALTEPAARSVLWRRLSIELLPEEVFRKCFGDSKRAFWLDTASQSTEDARFSFMGDVDQDSVSLVYRCDSKEIEIHRSESAETVKEPFFEVLARELRLHEGVECDEVLPFDFCGGFVGYFGYELKAECGGAATHTSDTPDAILHFCRRFLAFDLLENAVFLVALAGHGEDDTCRSWLDEMEHRLADLPSIWSNPTKKDHGTLTFELERNYPEYLEDIRRCQEHILDGRSYEICLTNRIRADVDVPPLDVYSALRETNPAPYSAYFRHHELAVLSSSPERFLHVDKHRVVSSKPIKGTRPRSRDGSADQELARELATSTKDRSENLMIVDLVRNDLGRCSIPDGVDVPVLMQVESFATVHQLVSTIRARLRDDCDSAELLRAAFPGGSMTGAPKRRTMELIDAIEHSARGIYSGSLGYLSVNGTVDLSIVIRTIVMNGAQLTIGSGGAIVALSDPDEEFKEMLLKSQALIEAIVVAARASGHVEDYVLLGSPMSDSMPGSEKSA